MVARQDLGRQQEAPGYADHAGTVIWVDGKKVRNSAFVCLNGERLPRNATPEEAVNGFRHRYDKFSIGYERQYKPLGGGLVDLGSTRFTTPPPRTPHRRLEICADHKSNTNDPPDLQLVASTGLGGGLSSSTHAGGWCIQADGDGYSKAVRPARRWGSSVPAQGRVPPNLSVRSLPAAPAYDATDGIPLLLRAKQWFQAKQRLQEPQPSTGALAKQRLQEPLREPEC